MAADTTVECAVYVQFSFRVVITGAIAQGGGEGFPEDWARHAQQRREYRGYWTAAPKLRTDAGRTKGYSSTGAVISRLRPWSNSI